jgi:predicted TIM-barrel enzyme
VDFETAYPDAEEVVEDLARQGILVVSDSPIRAGNAG